MTNGRYGCGSSSLVGPLVVKERKKKTKQKQNGASSCLWYRVGGRARAYTEQALAAHEHDMWAGKCVCACMNDSAVVGTRERRG